jgi:hypothetical protein
LNPCASISFHSVLQQFPQKLVLTTGPCPESTVKCLVLWICTEDEGPLALDEYAVSVRNLQLRQTCDGTESAAATLGWLASDGTAAAECSLIAAGEVAGVLAGDARVLKDMKSVSERTGIVEVDKRQFEGEVTTQEDRRPALGLQTVECIIKKGAGELSPTIYVRRGRRSLTP